MALELKSFTIHQVKRPIIGHEEPSAVVAEATINLNEYSPSVKQEWKSLKEFDTVFLLHVEGMKIQEEEENRKKKFPNDFGILSVRGAEIKSVVEREKNGNQITYRLSLDPSQYFQDQMSDRLDIYTKCNVMIRLHAKEGNSRAILSTIRDLMNSESISQGNALPPWFKDIFLGYGNPNSATHLILNEKKTHNSTHPALPSSIRYFDMRDTFLSLEHAISSFPLFKNEIYVKMNDLKFIKASSLQEKEKDRIKPPFRVRFIHENSENSKEKKSVHCRIELESYIPPSNGPYQDEQNLYKTNHIPFTVRQIEAIQRSLNPGLSLLVGPPGSGKTDVAVQIASLLYHNFPSQRTLLITHSNEALNDLFEKISRKGDIRHEHMIRLGMGSSDLNLDNEEFDFSKTGRVEKSLCRRLYLLERVKRLAESIQEACQFEALSTIEKEEKQKLHSNQYLTAGAGSEAGIPHIPDGGYTCETSEYFLLFHIRSRIDAFHYLLSKKRKDGSITADSIPLAFPFHYYFNDSSLQTQWKKNEEKNSIQINIEIAASCFRHLQQIFLELRGLRPFELLQTSKKREEYMLSKQARIVALTCTHAALTRRRFIDLRFTYDNIIMEESGQIIDVEGFIPATLQKHDALEGPRLKRIIMIGDHRQLPPVIQNQMLQRVSHFDQSLFSRLVRLGVPTVYLSDQGRTRPEIANLFNWRYSNENDRLGNLPCTKEGWYTMGNPGFLHSFQFVNVGTLHGRGETCPAPHFYQNLAEAEYICSVYMYMRLLGYPAKTIAILTTYRGQKHLLKDVFEARCKSEIFGMPEKIETVDKYQGSQNDYILLSLVRTKTVGHLRDVRRLIVATSRARFGLYIFGRHQIFSSCIELQPAFQILNKKPIQLQLVKNEFYNRNERKCEDVPSNEEIFSVENVTQMGLIVQEMK
eukprot:g2237.t1